MGVSVASWNGTERTLGWISRPHTHGSQSPSPSHFVTLSTPVSDLPLEKHPQEDILQREQHSSMPRYRMKKRKNNNATDVMITNDDAEGSLVSFSFVCVCVCVHEMK